MVEEYNLNGWTSEHLGRNNIEYTYIFLTDFLIKTLLKGGRVSGCWPGTLILCKPRTVAVDPRC